MRARIGRGGMGVVYLARDTRLGRKVALKIIHPRRLGDRAVEAFLAEARVTARFNHPNIVAVYGAGEHEGRPYLALEYLEGATLREQLDAVRLPVGRTVRVAHAIAQALAEAHDSGVLHRDLKPENIFLARDGRVRVVDFGLARSTDEAVPVDGAVGPLDTQLAGTPLYMAPEQWSRGETSSASDVWAFGICLYEMLGGGHPFADPKDPNIARFRQALIHEDLTLEPLPEADTIPDELRVLVGRCLSRDTADRPSARQIVQVLDAVLHGRPADADEESPFRGLLPFTEEHAGQFFGREAELDRFVERLEDEPTLPVVGPSGAGKSSFVMAGVVPRLREQAFWLVIAFRPGRTPFETLSARLIAKETRTGSRSISAHTLDFGLHEPEDADVAPAPEAPPRRTPDELCARLRETPTALNPVLSEIARENRCNVLVVVDQLEEVFTQVEADAERHAFMTALCTAADDPTEPVRVVFTVRDDFLGRLAETPAAADALSRVALIRPLDRDALRETLIRPLQSRGYSFDDPTLVDDMVDEVAGSDAALPLLQFAARRMWDRRNRRERTLGRRDYEAIGGVGGALARHADDLVAGMPEAGQEAVRQILLRLVTDDGTRRALPWDEAVRGLDPRHGPATLERLVDARLLVVRDGAQRQVELAHESLVQTWARLRRWYAESREEVQLVGELEDAARLWERRGSRASELWSGETLLDAERALSSIDIPVSTRAERFLSAAVDLRERAQRNRRWLTLLGVALLGTIAVVSTMASFEYARQRRLALDQADHAEVARADALAAGAAAAYANGDTLAARAQLRSALSVRDSAAARALWWSLSDDVVIWQLQTPYWAHGHALGPDGSEVVVAASDGILRRFDNRTGAVRAYRTPGTTALAAAAIDGETVAAADFDGDVWVWRADGEPRQLEGMPDDVYPYHLEWIGPDRLMLYVYWPEGFRTAALIWEPGGQMSLRQTTQGHGRMAVSPDKTAIVSGNPRGGEVSWIDLEGLQTRTLGTLDRQDRVGRFAFSETGVAAVGRNVVVFEDGGERRFEGHPSAVRAAGYLGDGSRLAALGADGTIRMWDSASGELLRTVDLRIEGDPKINGGTITAGGLVHVNRESGLMLVDLNRPGEHSQERGHVGFVEGIALDPDGEWAASGGQDGTVRIWDAATGEQLQVLDQANGAIADLRTDPEGRWLAAAASSGNVVIWESETWRVVRVLDHPGDVKASVFTSDGRSLVTAEYVGWVRRWDLGGLADRGLEAPVPLAWQRQLDTNLFDLDVVPGGDRFVASDFYGRLHTARLDSGEQVRVIDAHRAQAHTVLARADDTALSLGFDDHLRGWDLRTGKALEDVETEGASGVGVSPDGDRVVLGDAGGTWFLDLESGERRALTGPPTGPSGARFRADGKALGIGDDAGTFWLVDGTSGEALWSPGIEGGAIEDVDRTGVTASYRDGDRLWLGFSDGSFALHEGATPSWVRPPASAVVAMLEGPGETLITAHRDGHLVLWDTATGGHLLDRKLHGAPVRLERAEGAIVATTVVGDRETLDLRVFEADRCDILREVEQVIPTIWQGDRIVLADSPSPCD